VKRLLFFFLAVLAASPGHTAELMQFAVDGHARKVLMTRPAGQGPHPTLIVMHGGGGTAELELQLSGLSQLGPRDGFVAAFPEAMGGYWNFFTPGRETKQYVRLFQHLGGVPDDVAFLRALTRNLAQNGIADPQRTYLVGRSIGGIMALRLACIDAQNFAAIGLLVSAMPDVTGADCHPPKPLPVLMINGTADRVLPYGGLRSPLGDSLWSTQRLVDFFSRLNGCAEATHQIVSTEHIPNVVIERSIGCAGGPVVLYRIVGGGHAIPAALNASQVLLDFFRDKTR
jgi:polyhydroxybutyrate depolymerase